MSRETVWESERAKIIKVAENEYEVLAQTCRNEDGIVTIDWNFIATFTNSYCYDWKGNICATNYNPENKSDFAYEKALECAKSYV